MKRLISVLLVLLMLLSVACAEGENTLLRHAVELGRELDELAEDEEHIAKYAVDEAARVLIGTLAEGDRTTPSKVLALNYSAVSEMIAPQISELSEVAKRSVMNRVPSLLLRSMVSADGVRTATAFAVVHATDVYAASDVNGQGLWLLYYEDASPVAVAWYAENGAVAMEAAVLLPDSDVAFSDLESLTYVVAAARPALDAAAGQLATELKELAGNSEVPMLMDLSAEVVGMVRDYAADVNGQPQLILCTLIDDALTTQAALLRQIGMIGVQSVAAVSGMQHSMIFADPDASGTGLYLFLYEDGAPIIVNWTGENGAYHLSGSFQPGEYPASCGDVDDVNAWAASIGLNVRFQLPGAMLLP